MPLLLLLVVAVVVWGLPPSAAAPVAVPPWVLEHVLRVPHNWAASQTDTPIMQHEALLSSAPPTSEAAAAAAGPSRGEGGRKEGEDRGLLLPAVPRTTTNTSSRCARSLTHPGFQAVGLQSRPMRRAQHPSRSKQKPRRLPMQP